MTKEKFLIDIERLQKEYEQTNKQVDKLSEMFGSDLEVPLYTAMFGSLDLCTRLVSEKYELDLDAVNWFIWDNEWGSKKMPCLYKGQTVIVDSAETFWVFEKLDNIKG